MHDQVAVTLSLVLIAGSGGGWGLGGGGGDNMEGGVGWGEEKGEFVGYQRATVGTISNFISQSSSLQPL